MTEQKNTELNDKDKEAENIVSQSSEDIKAAAEAMRRTVRFRRTQVVQPRQYIYKQIF